MKRTLCCKIILFFFLPYVSFSQTNLLLNGGFEDVNTCTEYKAECGVEAWFYLKDVKTQMLENENPSPLTGSNSFGIFFNWLGYTKFSPLIGTLLPCRLQKGRQYSFRGLVSAKLNPKLIFKTGVCLGEKFYVPSRPFAKDMQPDSIAYLKRVPNTNFYQFEYSFIATGAEKYLTFGTYIEQDPVVDKGKKLTGTQTVSVVLDNFQLVPADEKETTCAAFEQNKKIVYGYDFRHREMDYSLFGRGELTIVFDEPDSTFVTQIKEPAEIFVPKTDTLKLGDVLFDFNKAVLKPEAVKILSGYFLKGRKDGSIDSVYIEGHTDSVGSDKRNMELSKQRCSSVKDWMLLNNVISSEQASLHAFGKTRPIASNKTAQGRSLNRRVEIIIFRRRD